MDGCRRVIIDVLDSTLLSIPHFSWPRQDRTVSSRMAPFVGVLMPSHGNIDAVLYQKMLQLLQTVSTRRVLRIFIRVAAVEGAMYGKHNPRNGPSILICLPQIFCDPKQLRRSVSRSSRGCRHHMYTSYIIRKPKVFMASTLSAWHWKSCSKCAKVVPCLVIARQSSMVWYLQQVESVFQRDPRCTRTHHSR